MRRPRPSIVARALMLRMQLHVPRAAQRQRVGLEQPRRHQHHQCSISERRCCGRRDSPQLHQQARARRCQRNPGIRMVAGEAIHRPPLPPTSLTHASRPFSLALLLCWSKKSFDVCAVQDPDIASGFSNNLGSWPPTIFCNVWATLLCILHCHGLQLCASFLLLQISCLLRAAD